ncbi:exonuclease, putative [Salinibacter ruber DSM 13855]|uniref:Exonuclease, putative n=2 Tax=Salinibacter ruber TaxID=146919 RepID=Q2S4M8_SALRD|nr:exonuclease, putative [Salinibacter ruber DSM 13855]
MCGPGCPARKRHPVRLPLRREGWTRLAPSPPVKTEKEAGHGKKEARALQKPPRSNAPINHPCSAMDVFLDTETTGSGPQDAVIELGVVAAQGEVLIHTLVAPLAPVTRGARRVHGITDEELADAPPFPTVADRLDTVLADAECVWTFGPTYDRRMLLQTAALAECPETHRRIQDSTWRDLQPDATRVLGDAERVALTDAAKRLDVSIPTEGHHHRALYDAKLARRVWTSVRRPASG